MAQCIMSKATLSKIKIYGDDYLPALLEEVDAEALPEVLGGKCRCDQGCVFSDVGPWREGDWPMPGYKLRSAHAADQPPAQPSAMESSPIVDPVAS